MATPAIGCILASASPIGGEGKQGDNNQMTKFIVKAQNLLAKRESDEGATMVEYGLVVAAIAIVALVGAQLVGTNLLELFNDIAGELA
jgi:pilus assembly protein Flp/PilA